MLFALKDLGQTFFFLLVENIKLRENGQQQKQR